MVLHTLSKPSSQSRGVGCTVHLGQACMRERSRPTVLSKVNFILTTLHRFCAGQRYCRFWLVIGYKPYHISFFYFFLSLFIFFFTSSHLFLLPPHLPSLRSLPSLPLPIHLFFPIFLPFVFFILSLHFQVPPMRALNQGPNSRYTVSPHIHQLLPLCRFWSTYHSSSNFPR